jgi:hypothetical protein
MFILIIDPVIFQRNGGKMKRRIGNSESEMTDSRIISEARYKKEGRKTK